MSSRCPLYQEAVEEQPWNRAGTANAGLLFDKFAHCWQDEKWRFDKGAWLESIARSISTSDGELLAEACQRQYELSDALGGVVRCFTNDSRFLTGLGRSHPLENGFTFHSTLGTPYLPGSGVKGVLRTWLRECHGTLREPPSEEGRRWAESGDVQHFFGDQGCRGDVIYLDLLPMEPPKLAAEIMTPHYGPYYQDGETPGDWHSPVPIPFLAVEDGQRWQLAILPVHTGRMDRATVEGLADDLVEALAWLGAGAKTAVGYGRFQRDAEAEEGLQSKAERQRRERAEDSAFEASLAGDSEPLRHLKRLCREQEWQQSAAEQRMVRALTTFADEHPDPPQDCLAWIRGLLEGIPNYKGVWSEPDAMRGKAKSRKPKYKARTIRELVKRLNPDLRA